MSPDNGRPGLGINRQEISEKSQSTADGETGPQFHSIS